MIRTCLIAAPLAAMLVLPPAAVAQSDRAAQSLIDALKPRASGPSRGLRMPSEPVVATPAPVSAWTAPAVAAPRQVLAVSRPVVPVARETTSDAPSVSITVTFASGAAMLTRQAEQALEPLGRALSSAELAPYRFRIEGHTDTVGEPTLNQALSERRAEAVREHLASRYNVALARLTAVGFGASQLLVATPANVPEVRNRRVQVVNIGE